VVCNSERLPIVKVSWNPLCEVELVTWMASSAFITSAGAGSGTPGPISSERWIPLST
jgi:hypothetical protein